MARAPACQGIIIVEIIHDVDDTTAEQRCPRGPSSDMNIMFLVDSGERTDTCKLAMRIFVIWR
jgi:hypothetical protein